VRRGDPLLIENALERWAHGFYRRRPRRRNRLARQ